jgi:hypothetical protein
VALFIPVIVDRHRHLQTNSMEIATVRAFLKPKAVYHQNVGTGIWQRISPFLEAGGHFLIEKSN